MITSRSSDLIDVKKILAVSIGGLGDTVLFSPVFKALRVRYPDSRIDLLVASPLAKEVYKCAVEIDRLLMAELKHSSLLIKASKILPKAIKSRISGGYDIAVFATGLNPQLGSLLKIATGIRHIFNAPKPPLYDTDMACNLYLARRFNPQASEQDLFVPISDSGRAEAGRILKQIDFNDKREHLIALYPSSELPHRPRWEIFKLLEVAKRLKRDRLSIKFVVVGSRQEGADWSMVDKRRLVDANLAGDLSLQGITALIAQCSLTLGNDGGLVHVAGAVQCPLVVIMPNTPLSYMPPGGETTVIRSKLTCCTGLYPKRPLWCKDADCTEDISVEDVYEACRNTLNKQTRLFTKDR